MSYILKIPGSILMILQVVLIGLVSAYARILQLQPIIFAY